MIAVRAPPGSTIEIPSEMQIKEKQALALKDRQEYVDRAGEIGSQGFEREEYDELLSYLDKKYQIFINASRSKRKGEQIQVYYISNVSVPTKPSNEIEPPQFLFQNTTNHNSLQRNEFSYGNHSSQQ